MPCSSFPWAKLCLFLTCIGSGIIASFIFTYLYESRTNTCLTAKFRKGSNPTLLNSNSTLSNLNSTDFNLNFNSTDVKSTKVNFMDVESSKVFSTIHNPISNPTPTSDLPQQPLGHAANARFVIENAKDAGEKPWVKAMSPYSHFNYSQVPPEVTDTKKPASAMAASKNKAEVSTTVTPEKCKRNAEKAKDLGSMGVRQKSEQERKKDDLNRERAEWQGFWSGVGRSAVGAFMGPY